VALSRNSLLLFAASWLLLAVFFMPAHAAEAGTTTAYTSPALPITDTIPLFKDNLMVNKAHLSGAQSGLPEARETLRTVRDSYRAPPGAEDLPPDTAHAIISVARTLDIPAGRLWSVPMDACLRGLTEVAASP